LAGFAIAFLIATESLSRAVVVSFLLLLLVFILRPYISTLSKVAISLILSATLLFQIGIMQNFTFLVDNFANFELLSQRFQEQTTEDDRVGGRGYLRIIDHPEYLVFGAGEGAHYRFGTLLEIHSGLGAILFSYGLLGFTLFGIFILTIFQRAHWALWIIMFAVMGYGITHQHVRFTGFWILMGMTYAMTRYIIPHRGQASSPLPR
jgi:hypothetical protein